MQMTLRGRTMHNVPEMERSSFRDPSGFVYRCGNELLRQINTCYEKQYHHLMQSGLYDTLVEKGLLVAHEESMHPGISDGALCVIKPELAPFISYPYEWCFGQIKDAALTTLAIQKIALQYGMILKDASAYNIQFINGTAKLIDTLSFDFYKGGMPWVAYGQFCRHFLAPLFLMKHVDLRLSQLLRIYLDGVPLDLASTLLRRKGGMAVKQHIHWHARSIQRHAEDGKTAGPVRRIKISKANFSALMDSLYRIIDRLELKRVKTEWGAYYATTNYSNASARHKGKLVASFLERVSPETVWDLGANDGTYSRIALEGNTDVVAFDIDYMAVERNYAAVKKTKERMLPLLLDLTNPSPRIGFANEERGSLAERQRPDCIMMLAVIHHLAISNNVPLEKIAAWLAGMGNWLIIEFVPKQDSQVRVILTTRDDVFPQYTSVGFEAAFNKYFYIREQQQVEGSERVLYLMQAMPVAEGR